MREKTNSESHETMDHLFFSCNFTHDIGRDGTICLAFDAPSSSNRARTFGKICMVSHIRGMTLGGFSGGALLFEYLI